MKISNKNNSFIITSILFSIISIINSYFYLNKTIMHIIVIFQVLFLFFLLVKRKYTSYYCFYCGFLALSLEFPDFVGSDFYGLKSIKIAGINIGVLLIIPLFICLLVDRKVVRKSSKIDNFFIVYLFFIIVSLLNGILNFILNDNGIANVAGIQVILDSIYPYMFIFLCFVCIYLLFKKKFLDFKILEDSLFSIIVAVAITMCFSFLSKNYGVYGGIETLQVSAISMTLPCSLVVLMYRDIDIRKRLIVFSAAIVITLLSLLFNANGKIVLSVGITVLFFLFVSFKTKKKLFIVLMVMLPFVIIVGLSVMSQMVETSFLLKLKVEQALSTISFWKEGWFENMSESPKFRIEEFLTILDEYTKKPWSLPFGKGFMATTRDNLGYYVSASATSFSDFELKTGLFMNMHESLNNLFLVGGLFGLFFYVKYLIEIIKSSRVSFWGVLGTFWFALFFKYSITIGVFGISVFAFSLILLDKKNVQELIYGN